MCRKPWVKEGSVAAAKVSAAIMGQGGKNLADIDHMSGIINHTVCSVPNSSSRLIFVKIRAESGQIFSKNPGKIRAKIRAKLNFL